MLEMKILICTPEYGSIGTGIKNVAENLVRHLKAKGHKIEIISPEGPDIQIGNPEKWKKQGGKEILRFWDKIYDLLEDPRSTEDCDIIWCHNPLFRKQLPKYITDKTFCTTHTTYNGRWKYMPYAVWPKDIAKNIFYAWMNKQEQKAYKSMANLRFIVLTKQIGEEIKELGISESTIIPNGVDTSIFHPEGEKDPNLGCVATRLTSWKNVQEIIDKFNNTKYSIWIAGNGPEKKKLKKRAAKNIIFLGNLNQIELIKLYQKSTFYISTSKYEGMPLTLLEALACGCIPLVSDIPGHKEIIEEGDLEAVTNPQKIFEFIKNNYDWNIITEKYLEVFQNVK